MQNTRIHFAKEDIGAEILPILTSGLYRDSLDTLREYIQNGIDADATQIQVSIDPDTVSIHDNGYGMDLDQARHAIRLGISDKNPKTNVGFRGIGIYSAFNLCDHVEIHTRTSSFENGGGCIIHFDFGRIRRQLLQEQTRRADGNAPTLFLESLLESSVYVETTDDSIIEGTGTRVILSGLLSDAYARINDHAAVTDYLQNVIPLPFSPEFKFSSIIAERFAQEDYHTVELILSMRDQEEPIYRPYTNSVFKNGGTHPPYFVKISHRSTEFGFAWVCVNDARETIKNERVRGLLIKKFGFSVSDRKYLEPFFGRTVYSRRITGEVIIKHPDLIPNAARSDFENNSTRQLFLETLPRFTREIDSWANDIQEDDRAREVLTEISGELASMHDGLLPVQRDRERLLTLNVQLADIEKRLKPHIKRLEKSDKDALTRARELLHGTQSFVKEALLSQRKASAKIEQEVVRTVQRTELASSMKEPHKSTQTLDSLYSALDAFDLVNSNDLRRAIEYIDERMVKPQFPQEKYAEALLELQRYLEENT